MLILLLKITACSGLFLLFYKLFLQREKMFRFNRAYLLLALVFSTVVPFFTMELNPKQESKTNLTFNEPIVQVIQNQPTENPTDYYVLFMLIYCAVSCYLMLKSLLGIYRIVNLKGEVKFNHGIRAKVVQYTTPPFTFWETLYLNSEDDKKGLDQRILDHEKTHISQLHTIDLLVIELFKIIFWLNPFIYVYHNLIKTNHEFLADEAVLKQHFNIKDYQKLILSEVERTISTQHSHAFFNNNTKKRFIMMNTTKSKFQWSKKLSIVPLVAAAFVLFSEKTSAKAPEKKTKSESIESVIQPISKYTVDSNENTIRESLTDTLPKKKVKSHEIKKDKSTIEPTTTVNPSAITEMAEYPGGVSALRKKITEDFDVDKITNEEGMYKSKINFVIDKNGDVKNFNVEGESPSFNKIVHETAEKVAKVKWNPATKNGEKVESYYSLPITMFFEHYTKIQPELKKSNNQ